MFHGLFSQLSYLIGNVYDESGKLINEASDQWLGSTVVSGGEDGTIVVSEQIIIL